MQKPAFFDTIAEMEPRIAKSTLADGTFALEYTVYGNRSCKFELCSADGVSRYESATFVQREDITYKLYVAFPSQGDFILRCYYGNGNDRQYNSCAEYGFHSTKGSAVRYPVQYSSFKSDIKLVSPIAGPLERGKVYVFEVYAPGWKYVALILGSQFNHLTKGSDGTFSKSIAIPYNISECKIGISNTEYGQYEGILRFPIK